MGGVTDPALLGGALVNAINAGNLDGVMLCYADDAVLELPDGTTAVGQASIREFYADLLVRRPQFSHGEPEPALVHGDVALTNTKIGATATAEVARRQADGSWRWILDRPNVLLVRA